MRAALSLAAVVAAVSLACSTAQEQPRPYRGGTDVVAVYATVTDASGHLVPNLQKSDFTVSDNGKKQPIAVFSNDIQPITIVIMLDRSGSMAENFELVRDATRRVHRQAAAGRQGAHRQPQPRHRHPPGAVHRRQERADGGRAVRPAGHRPVTGMDGGRSEHHGAPAGGRPARRAAVFRRTRQPGARPGPHRRQGHHVAVEGGRDHGLLHRADERELPARRPDLSAAAPARAIRRRSRARAGRRRSSRRIRRSRISRRRAAGATSRWTARWISRRRSRGSPRSCITSTCWDSRRRSSTARSTRSR